MSEVFLKLLLFNGRPNFLFCFFFFVLQYVYHYHTLHFLIDMKTKQSIYLHVQKMKRHIGNIHSKSWKWISGPWYKWADQLCPRRMLSSPAIRTVEASMADGVSFRPAGYFMGQVSIVFNYLWSAFHIWSIYCFLIWGLRSLLYVDLASFVILYLSKLRKTSYSCGRSSWSFHVSLLILRSYIGRWQHTYYWCGLIVVDMDIPIPSVFTFPFSLYSTT